MFEIGATNDNIIIIIAWIVDKTRGRPIMSVNIFMIDRLIADPHGASMDSIPSYPITICNDNFVADFHVFSYFFFLLFFLKCMKYI